MSPDGAAGPDCWGRGAWRLVLGRTCSTGVRMDTRGERGTEKALSGPGRGYREMAGGADVAGEHFPPLHCSPKLILPKVMPFQQFNVKRLTLRLSDPGRKQMSCSAGGFGKNSSGWGVGIPIRGSVALHRQ